MEFLENNFDFFNNEEDTKLKKANDFVESLIQHNRDEIRPRHITQIFGTTNCDAAIELISEQVLENPFSVGYICRHDPSNVMLMEFTVTSTFAQDYTGDQLDVIKNLVDECGESVNVQESIISGFINSTEASSEALHYLLEKESSLFIRKRNCMG